MYIMICKGRRNINTKKNVDFNARSKSENKKCYKAYIKADERKCKKVIVIAMKAKSKSHSSVYSQLLCN